MQILTESRVIPVKSPRSYAANGLAGGRRPLKRLDVDLANLRLEIRAVPAQEDAKPVRLGLGLADARSLVEAILAVLPPDGRPRRTVEVFDVPAGTFHQEER